VKHFSKQNVAGFVRNRRSSTTLGHPVSNETSYMFRENASERWPKAQPTSNLKDQTFKATPNTKGK
jgi:hypothetical protein